MKITVELEHKEEINTPMLFADAVERFLVQEYEPYYVENFLEVVDHLNVRANYMRRDIRRRNIRRNEGEKDG